MKGNIFICCLTNGHWPYPFAVEYANIAPRRIVYFQSNPTTKQIHTYQWPLLSSPSFPQLIDIGKNFEPIVRWGNFHGPMIQKMEKN